MPTLTFYLKGIDLTKDASALMASKARSFSEDGDDEEDLFSLISVFPNQGHLGPGEMGVIHFKFSPRFQRSNLGWKSTEDIAPRKDYALFMHIDAVGTINKNEEGTLKQGIHVVLSYTS